MPVSVAQWYDEVAQERGKLKAQIRECEMHAKFAMEKALIYPQLEQKLMEQAVEAEGRALELKAQLQIWEAKVLVEYRKLFNKK